ncbi:MAG: glycosyltransferase family 2 protein [Clostridia bacterium]|nr:glycosyltransferase family 2 protein [Clostridia bacterium]MBQ1663328.1 glycosyltransferase family 2 protein [Clostridia bacterium]MBQ2566878.1 glycosyltransferase family 2 protein [Clostridia bacterium]MBQ3327351.1 glycosyltransferase family 2 protein [Clostridia bacterium]MBQ3995893.1 glycosyltransferase family 2 protein [Clostridia bacterium]
MANVTVSVIMPVYGVEDYVGGAIESIQAQTLADWELFCVDDGSKDRSGEVCDSYAAKDPRIHVIHKENGGAPSARNVAIDQAEGKYLYFCDADDWAEKTMLSDMVRIAEENGSQLVVAGFYIDTFYSDTEKFTQSQEVPSRVFATQREFREHAHELFDQNLLYTPWNKLFLASYIKDNKLYFPQTFWDDFPFNLSVVRDIEKVAVTSEKYYHFIRKREESETARYRSDMYEKREEEDGWMKDLYAYWNVSSPESKEFLDRRYIERLVGCVENLTNKNCDLSRRAKLKEIRQYITTPRAKEAVKNAQPRSGYMKVMLIPFKLRSTLLTYLESNVISYVKSGNTKLFATLKAHR